jgi:hypothetical protein
VEAAANDENTVTSVLSCASCAEKALTPSRRKHN